MNMRGYNGDPAAQSPAEERDEARQAGPDYYRCPQCNAIEPGYEEGRTTGFAGGWIYWVAYSCCGHTEVDESDDLAAAQ